jgi:hypothetical protein
MDDDVWGEGEVSNNKEIINSNKTVKNDNDDKTNVKQKDIFDDILDIHEKPIEQPKKPEPDKVNNVVEPKKQADKKKKAKYVKPKQTVKLNKYDKEYDDQYDDYYND